MDHSLADVFLLQELEKVAGQLGITVRYDNLADEEISIHSGACRVRGRTLIIIDAGLSFPVRASLLGRELSLHNLDELYILPRIREFIGLQSPPPEKNLPQR